MTDGELKKLKRRELLEMLIEQGKENQQLRESLEEAEAALRERQLKIDKAGTMSEAAIALNGVYEAADAAARQYLENLQQKSGEIEAEQERLLAEAQAKAEAITSEAQTKADAAIAEARKEAEEIVGQAKEKAETIIAGAQKSGESVSAGVQTDTAADEAGNNADTAVDEAGNNADAAEAEA